MPRISFLVLLAMTLINGEFADAQDQYDVILRGGRVVDGTGAPWFEADVAIDEGHIAKIGRIPADVKAGRVIDVHGLIVAPGFIDMMGQTATPMLRNPQSAINLLTQGITTINAGEGVSAAPLSEAEGASEGWQTMAEYFTLLDMKGLPVNVVQSVGHAQVRQMVLGEIDRRPTDDELKKMQALVEEGMQAGAIGVSTALIYPPATYASLEEIAALCEVAGRYGGRYYTHMRNEGNRLPDAIDEALEIGRLGKVPVHIFHLKAAGEQNWGKMEQAITRIKAARATGQQVAADVYPYINNGLGIAAFIHPRHFTEGFAKFLNRIDDPELRKTIREEMETSGEYENWYQHCGRDWGKVVVGQTSDKEFRDSAGKSVKDLAAQSGKDPWDVFFQLVKGDTFALPQTMAEANLAKAMREQFVSFCTDVGPADGKGLAAHPRAFGSFPRLLSRYVREWGVISLERAVAQASALAANEVMAYDRGRISVGQAADVIVFDEKQIVDRATFAEPRALSEGMKYVLVNGVVVLDDGKQTDRRPGRVLRGPGYDEKAAPYNISTGSSDRRLAKLDEVVQKFMREHHTTGAALAVTDHGRLVYSRAFGYADVAGRKPVEPTSLFRIASISKPITAVAILQLIEQGKFKLDDPVLPLLKHEPFIAEGGQPDPRWKDITIRDLLDHSGGWDRDKSFDAMFQATEFAKLLGIDAPAGPNDVIRVMLGKPLDFDPGTRYAYSNLGYCILGRLIETHSGQAYEEYVKQHVLAPIGITQMRLGRTHLADCCEGEVRYYDPHVDPSVFQATLGQQVPSAYGAWHFEAMDAHGAWLASAVDLVRFGSAFDDPEKCPLLKAGMVREMFAKPEGVKFENADKTFYYGLGWSHRTTPSGIEINAHSGSLPGTSTLLSHRSDGRNTAILFNTRVSPTATHLTGRIDPALQAAIDEIKEWPEGESLR